MSTEMLSPVSAQHERKLEIHMLVALHHAFVVRCIPRAGQAVALGAAVQAGILSGSLQGHLVMDVWQVGSGSLGTLLLHSCRDYRQMFSTVSASACHPLMLQAMRARMSCCIGGAHPVVVNGCPAKQAESEVSSRLRARYIAVPCRTPSATDTNWVTCAWQRSWAVQACKALAGPF